MGPFRIVVSALASAALVIAVWVSVGCDRAVEPYDPAEQARQPDLSKIFPAGAERRTQPAALPPAPGGRTGQRGAPALASSAEPIRGTVTVAGDVADRVPATSVLFVIARSGEAGPPLAVRRIASPQFPLDFAIGPGDRMITALPFAGPLRLTARLDGDGNAATLEPGDLLGVAEGDYQPGDRGVSLVIDEVM
jgi:cytochrome c-type biogenesis protein CcmH